MATRRAVAARMVSVIITTIIIMVVTVSGRARADVTCEAYTTTTRTNITCYFGQNINKSRDNFNVFYYPSNSTSSSESPLACNWKKADASLLCIKDPNVRFNYKVSEQLTLSLPAALDKVGGLYVCQTVPSLPSSAVHPCTLLFKDFQGMATGKSGSQTFPTHPPSGYDSEGHLAASIDCLTRVSEATLAILLVFIIAIIIILFVHIVYRKRKWIRKWLTPVRSETSETLDVASEEHGLAGNDPQNTTIMEVGNLVYQAKGLAYTRAAAAFPEHFVLACVLESLQWHTYHNPSELKIMCDVNKRLKGDLAGTSVQVKRYQVDGVNESMFERANVLTKSGLTL